MTEEEKLKDIVNNLTSHTTEDNQTCLKRLKEMRLLVVQKLNEFKESMDSAPN